MIDEIFFKEHYNRRPLNYLLFGFVMTAISIVSGLLLFGNNSSVAQLLLATLLHIPLISRLFRDEERIIRKTGIHHLFRNHKKIFELFGMVFIGMTLAFLIVQLLTVHNPGFFSEAFSYQINFIQSQENPSGGIFSSIGVMHSIFNNFIVLIIVSFLLSFLYGAGSFFLLVFTASITSTLMLFLARMMDSFPSYVLLLLLLFGLVLFPMILSCIAGGIISRAVVCENLHRKKFWNVVKDGMFLFMISLVLALIFSALRIWLLSRVF